MNDFKKIVRRSVNAQHEKIYSVIFLVAAKCINPCWLTFFAAIVRMPSYDENAYI